MDRATYERSWCHHGVYPIAVAIADAGRRPAQFEGTIPVYTQSRDPQESERIILHLVNLSTPDLWRIPVEEVLSVGTQTISIHGRLARRITRGQSLVDGDGNWIGVRRDSGGIEFDVEMVGLHQVVVLE